MPAYDSAELPTCREIPLSSSKVAKKTLAAIPGILFIEFLLVLFVLPVLGNTGVAVFICIILFAVILVVTYLYQIQYFKNYYYDLKDEMIVIRKGVFAPKEISLPYERIQNVYVDRDILDTIFGLYDVHLETAAFGSGMSAHLDGVNEENATKLKEIIMKHIEKGKGTGL
jgi:putative membrane protein